MNAIRPPADANWVSRNKFLFVNLLLAGILIAGGGIVLMVVSLMKSSDAYQLGLAKAAADPDVIASIGSPIEAGMFVSGSIRTSNASGRADLSIPVKAPKGAGTVRLRAERSLGKWTLTALVFENDVTHQRIDLLKPNGKGSQ
jgi:hypothetical protein